LGRHDRSVAVVLIERFGKSWGKGGFGRPFFLPGRMPARYAADGWTKSGRMSLDVTPLENTVNRLREGLSRYRQNVADTQIRDGLIQRFEFTYELSHKMLKRHLAMAAANPAEFDEMNFSDLIRSGNQRGLLRGDWPRWRIYRDMRAKTSHTYDEDVALEVVRGIDDFLAEAEYLLDRLKSRPA
jgi:nucleotidyltransferase substrate binding protein (TIGR01987 family)